MIFVVLGTHELPFKRLLKEIDKQIQAGTIEDEVIVQVGHTSYKSTNMNMFTFTSYEEMEQLYKKADLIITHGGTGSITTGVKFGKKMIAAPRLIKYGEHNDNHQLEIVNQFKQAGHILAWNDGQNLKEMLEESKSFVPVPFISGKKEILSIIRDFIDNNG